MIEYPKIESLFVRSSKTYKFMEGLYRTPEFHYLEDNDWYFTEKVDGTNIRVQWRAGFGLAVGEKQGITFRGRTDRAQIPPFLLDKLNELFTCNQFRSLYPDTDLCLYGEGYGARIQKGGGNYIPDGVSFVLFDVMIDGWWLRRPDVEDVAQKLAIKVAPVVGSGKLSDAVRLVKNGFKSTWGDFPAEGIVAQPKVQLMTRAGERIITKIKHKDFER